MYVMPTNHVICPSKKDVNLLLLFASLVLDCALFPKQCLLVIFHLCREPFFVIMMSSKVKFIEKFSLSAPMRTFCVKKGFKASAFRRMQIESYRSYSLSSAPSGQHEDANVVVPSEFINHEFFTSALDEYDYVRNQYSFGLPPGFESPYSDLDNLDSISVAPPDPLSPALDLCSQFELQNQGFMGKIGSFFNTVDMFTHPKTRGIGCRTATAIVAMGGVIKEWITEFHTLVMGLLPTFSDIRQSMANFFTVVFRTFSSYAQQCSRGFMQLYDSMKQYLFGSKTDEFVEVEKPVGSYEEILINNVGESITENFLDPSKKIISKFFYRVFKVATAMVGMVFDSSVLKDVKGFTAGLRDYLNLSLVLSRVNMKDNFQQAMNWVYYKFTGKDWYPKFEMYRLFEVKVKFIETLLNDQDRLTNPTLTASLEISRAMAALESIELSLKKVDPRLSAHITGMYTTLRARTDAYRASVAGTMRRIKPVSVFFFGAASQGKTDAQKKLIKQLIPVISKFMGDLGLPADHPAHQIWASHSLIPSAKSVGCVEEPEEYPGTGYGHPFFYCLEELYSSLSTDTNNTWAGRVFALNDDQPFSLNAAFGNKGTVYFDSPVLIATGNANSHVIPCKSATAYHRRIDFDFVVTRGPGDSSTNTFRLTKEAKRILSDPELMPNRAYSLCGYNFDDVLVFKQVLNLIAVAYVDRITTLAVADVDVNSYDFMKKKFSLPKNFFMEKSVFTDTTQLTPIFPTAAASVTATTTPPPSPPPPSPPSSVPPPDDKGKEKDHGTFDSELEPSIAGFLSNLWNGQVAKTGSSVLPIAVVDPSDVNGMTISMTQPTFSLENHGGSPLRFWLEYAKAIYFSNYCLISSKAVYHLTYAMHHTSDGESMPIDSYPVVWRPPPGLDIFSLYAKQRAWIGETASIGFETLDDGVALAMNERLFVRNLQIYAMSMRSIYHMSKTVYSPNKSKRNSFLQRSQDRDLLARVYLGWKSEKQRLLAFMLAGGKDGWLPADRDPLEITRARKVRTRLDNTHKARVNDNRDRLIRRRDARRALRGTAPPRPYTSERKSKKNNFRLAGRLRKEGVFNQGGPSSIIYGVDHIPELAVPFLPIEISAQFTPLLTDYAECVPCYNVVARVRKAFTRPTCEDVDDFINTHSIVDGEYMETLDRMLLAHAFSRVYHIPIQVILSLHVEKFEFSALVQGLRLTDPKFVVIMQCLYLKYCDSMNKSYTSADLTTLYELTTALHARQKGKYYSKHSVSNFDGYKGFFQFAVSYTQTTIPKLADYVSSADDLPMTLSQKAGFAAAMLVTAGAFFPFVMFLSNAVRALVAKPRNDVKITIDAPQSVVDELNVQLAASGYQLQSGENAHAVPKFGRHVDARTVHAAKVERLRMDNQSGDIDALNARIHSNTYTLVSSEVGIAMGALTFIRGTIAVMNSHIFDSVKNEFQLLALVPKIGQAHDVRVPKSAVKVLYRKDDLIVLDMSTGVRSHSNLTKFFAEFERIKNYSRPNAAWMVTRTPEQTPTVEPVTNYTVAFEGSIAVAAQASIPRRLISERISYNWINAKPGACGTFLCAMLNGEATIVGMHTAGNPSNQYGVSVILDLGSISTAIDTVNHCASLLSFSPDEEGIYEDAVTHFTTPLTTTATGATAFSPTPFYHCDVENCPKIPAALNLSAYQKALQKEFETHEKVQFTAPVYEVIQEYGDVITEKFLETMPVDLMGCRTLTFEEAMYGFAGKLDACDFTTARGPRLRSMGIKKRHLKNPQHPDVARLKVYVLEKIDKILHSSECDRQINCDALKDELRDHERVKALKTRIFNVTDFVDNLIIKMAIGDLVSRFKDRILFTPAKCGINPTGSLWSQIYNAFRGFPNLVAADIKGWDHMAAMWLSLLYIPWVTRCYGGNHFSAAVKLAVWAYLGARQSIRFNRGAGRELDRGNSSGNWATTFFNTFDNHCFHCIAVCLLAIDYDVEPIRALAVFVHVLYSDDNLSALPYPWWNIQNVAGVFLKHFGITMTTTDKGAIDLDGDMKITIDDAEFLSRRFVLRDGIVYAPLSRESLLAQLYFVRVPTGMKNQAFINSQLQINLANVSRELVEYPLEEATEIAAHINQVISSNQIPVYFPTLDYKTSATLKLHYY